MIINYILSNFPGHHHHIDLNYIWFLKAYDDIRYMHTQLKKHFENKQVTCLLSNG